MRKKLTVRALVAAILMTTSTLAIAGGSAIARVQHDHHVDKQLIIHPILSVDTTAVV